MTKNDLKKLMDKHYIVECELEDVIEFVNDLLYTRRCEIKNESPYATITIKRIQSAEEETWDLLCYIDEIMEDKEHD